MSDWFLLWHLWIGILVSHYGMFEAKPAASAEPSILEVSAGETAKLKCPSNDDNHRFQFWQLKSNEILGPGNKVNERKYKYEVLSGTLYIKAVAPNERGVYTCYCKHLTNTTYNAKSIMLVVKSDWQQLWDSEEVNLARTGAVFLILFLCVMAVYIVRKHKKTDKLIHFKNVKASGGVLDEVSSRKASYSLPKHSKKNNIKQGIDNPAHDHDDDTKGSTPTYGYKSRGDHKF